MTTGEGSARTTLAIDDLTDRLRADRAYWGHVGAAMRFKQALVARVGVEAAFPLAVQEVGVPQLHALRRRSPRSIGDVARTEGRAYRELWPGGACVPLPPPTVVGEGDHGALAVTERAAYLACLDDVLVRGRSDLLLRGDEALADFERDEYHRSRDNPEFDPAVLHANGTEFWTMEPTHDVPRLPEALMLCGAHSRGFGHWMTEFLPKLATARLAGWGGAMPVLVDEQIPGTVRTALAALLPADAPLFTVAHMAALRVDRLWCMANPAYAGFFPSESNTAADIAHWSAAPERFATLMREVAAMVDARTERPTNIGRVYLARKPDRRKRLVNDTSVAEVLRRRGFHCVYPEDLGLVEQFRLVRHARHIVAPDGSNSLLATMARPGAKACILSPPSTHRLVDVCATLAALGVEPTIFTGPCDTTGADYTEHPLWSFWNDYRIDATAFESFLQGWLASP